MFYNILTQMTGTLYKNKSKLMTRNSESQQKRQDKTKARISFLKQDIIKM